MSFSQNYLEQTSQIASHLDHAIIENIAEELAALRNRNGRLFFIGSGGGAGHSSHAVCDFRKLGNIECYTPSDNISELTARVNDDGWDTAYSNWLKVSNFNSNDAIFVFSVGGGSKEKNISVNLVNCISLANEKGASVMGVVGRDGGYTKESSDLTIVVPTIDDGLVTPHTEGWQAVVWHLLISHPKVCVNETKWESTK
ncbi:MAG: SIS domain-containing protein [SAR86 cluster bacterium]|nr:SIS domain-containing protein [SAR86 cluster bacterium]